MIKKLISLLTCFIFTFSFSVSAFAAGNARVTTKVSATTLKHGATVTVTVSLSNSEAFKSMSLTPKYDANIFEVVSGEWLLTDTYLKDFDNKNAVCAYTEPVTKNGAIFKYVLKVKDDAVLKDTTINTVATIKNGTTVIDSTAVSATVKFVCNAHSFSGWTKADNDSHRRSCSACGKAETVKHDWDSGKVTTAATCKKTGVKTFTCKVCKGTKTNVIAKTSDHNFSGWKETKAADCINAGSESRTCSVCAKVETRAIKALGHEFSNPTVTKAPTCTENGIESGKCFLCNEETTNSIKATGHNISDYEEAVKPTCTTEGKKVGKCSYCGKTAEEKIAKTEHKMKTATITREPTCTTAGVKEVSCINCGIKSEEEIAPKGHEFGKAVVMKQATETETGMKIATCYNCGATEQYEIYYMNAKPSPKGDNSDSELSSDGQSGGNTVLWVIAGFIFIIAVGAVITVIVLNNKNKEDEEYI